MSESASPKTWRSSLHVRFFFSSRRRHTRLQGDWSSDVCSSDLAYQRPSRSTRWKLPVPPSGPPLCEMPIECIVPAVGNGKSIRVSRITEKPMVERMQLLQLSEARPVLAPVNVWSSIAYDTNNRV